MSSRIHTIERARAFRRLLICSVLLVGGCADFPMQPHLPRPLKKPTANAAADNTLIAADTGFVSTQPTVTEGVSVPAGRMLAEPFATEPPPSLRGDRISINFDGLPLPTFVNTVFGELLKVTFEIDPVVAQRNQPVTLRTAEPMDRNAFFTMVTEVLRNYGISVVYQNNIYRVVESAAAKQDIPRIIRARAVPNIPDDMRPIFYFMQLKNVQTAFMITWLQVALKDRVQIQGVNQVNGVLVMGRRDDVMAAIETVEVLDQPHMAGSKSRNIVPQYWSAQKLAEQLNTVLNAEGYAAGIGPDGAFAIKLVPISALNTLIVFAISPQNMQHVLEWVTQLDRPGQTVNTQGIFYYPVQNTSAKQLADTLSQILGGGGGGDPAAPAAMQGGGPGQPPAAMQGASIVGRSVGNKKLIVDAARNAIIFQGTNEEFSQFRDLAQRMDRAPLEVLIEATIAEVTLSEGQDISSVLSFDDALPLKAISSSVKSDDGLFVSLLRDRGRFLAQFSASSNKNKVTILSSPRVVASSGQKASIQVGTQVPTITTQQTSANGTVNGSSTILQAVQYRDTGVILSIDPTINSNRRVELVVSQEVSEAQANKISDVQSPTIFKRSIETALSLNDGETVLLGGLISENVSDGNTGIPYLKDIPVLGNLFRTSSRGRTRIELVILLTPYIIDGPETSRAVRDAFRAELTGLLPDASPIE